MEKIKKVFCSNFDGEYQTELQAYVNVNTELYVEIRKENSNDLFEKQFICLDYHTAKKFVKHLKSEIKKAEIIKTEISRIESEVKNG